MKKAILSSLRQLGLKENIEVFERSLSMSEIIMECYKPEECLKACSECHNFNKLWCCPPYMDDYVELFCRNKILVIVTRVLFDDTEDDMDSKLSVYSKLCQTVHDILLDKEKGLDGIALSFVGNCAFCPPGTCTRSVGLPCRHPEKARRSLEGLGFDVGLILNKYFDLTLDWKENDKTFSFLTFVAGLIYQ